MGRPVGGGGAAPTPAPAPNGGRAPGAPERVGCGPRRSPGRIGGLVCPGVNWPGALPGPCAGVPGRGRAKIGLPRSGIPPRGGAVGTGRVGDGGGAAYTGRGPVCGTINRRGAGGRCVPVAGLWAGGATVADTGGGAIALTDKSLVAAATGTSAGGTSGDTSTSGSGISSVSTGMGTCSSV